jgi:hypothetical protein
LSSLANFGMLPIITVPRASSFCLLLMPHFCPLHFLLILRLLCSGFHLLLHATYFFCIRSPQHVSHSYLNAKSGHSNLFIPVPGSEAWFVLRFVFHILACLVIPLLLKAEYQPGVGKRN